MLDALKRLGRILLAQLVGYLITLPFPIPYLGVTVGAVINALAKYLRDKYGWTWLPV